MAKKALCPLLIILASILTAATAPNIADLEKKAAAASGKERLVLLIDLADAYYTISPPKSTAYARQALDFCRQGNHDPALQARALLALGKSLSLQSQYQAAIEALQEAEKLFSKISDSAQLGKTLRFMGNVYFFTSRYQEAGNYYSRGLSIAEKLGDPKECAHDLNNLGNVYCHLGKSDIGLTYYQKALPLYQRLEDRQGTALVLNNLALTSERLNNYELALDYFLQSLAIAEKNADREGISRASNNIGVLYRKIKQYDKALVYFQRALTIDEADGDKDGVGGYYMNIGNIYADKKDHPKALESYQRSLRIRKEIGNQLGTAKALGNISNIYKKSGQMDKALDYALQALAIQEKISAHDDILITWGNIGAFYLEKKDWVNGEKYLQRALKANLEAKNTYVTKDILENLANLYSERGDYRQAFDYYKRFTAAKDQLLNKETNEKMAEIEAKYEVDKKKREIELLQKNNEIQRLRLTKQRWVTYALVAGLSILFFLLLVLFHKYRYLFAFWKRKTYVGHFKLEEKIASGGMGVIYKARDVLDSSKIVAVKVIREELVQDESQRKRFLNEGHIIDKLAHPNIIKVFERGEHQQTLFIAMEYLQGRSLAQVIGQGILLPMDDCREIMSQVTNALIQIHRQGIVHRDIKPENVMLLEGSPKPVVKLLDFGLAKDPNLTNLTETGELLGTIPYLPPEYIRNQVFSPAGDIYALGVIFYESLTLAKPFFGENPGEIVRAILENEMRPPINIRPDLKPSINDLVMSMLGKSPEQRPTAEELASILGSQV